MHVFCSVKMVVVHLCVEMTASEACVCDKTQTEGW